MKIGAIIRLMVLLLDVDPMKMGLVVIEKNLDQSLDLVSVTTVKRKDIGKKSARYSKRKRRKAVLQILVM